MANTLHNDLFSSLISDIKAYSGNDPLLPWLRGVRKMRETLPPQLLNEKLPRFLQKCAQTFDSDRRYRNDLRFLRIWLQLMDYVDDPRALLRTMEVKKIGTKRALFYKAYALYYEKMKKFEEAEKMYRLGVQNLAEPLDELHKSYEEFLHRLERHKTKRVQLQQRRTARRPLGDMSLRHERSTTRDNAESSCEGERTINVCPTESSSKTELNDVKHDLWKMPIQSHRNDVSLDERDSSTAAGNSSELEIPSHLSMKKEVKELASSGNLAKHHGGSDKSNEGSTLHRDDTVVIKFVDTAMVGKSEAEDAIHHGLVDPTINMKEAMDAINNMFREPLEPAVNRRSRRSQQNVHQNSSCGLEVFVDENLDDRVRPFKEKNKMGFLPANAQIKTQQPVEEPFKIFIDEEGDEVNEKCNGKDDSGPSEVNIAVGESPSSSADAFVFLRPNDNCSESTKDLRKEKSSKRTFREDTMVCRFVGAAISDEPEVENICHHGLVDPTINLKEAMDDINNMFGKPIDFVRTTRKKRQAATCKNNFSGFSILADDDLVPCKDQQPLPRSSRKEDNHDLFEQTVCTKEAIDDINKMFSLPLDF